LIDGSCSDANECLIKDSNGNCRRGCKYSSEITTSCVIDGCIQYSSGVCSTISGCVLVEGFCVGSFEDFGCIGVDSESACLSISNCDIFLGGVCGERVLYDKDCSLIGEDVCFDTSICRWDPRVGCVEVEEDQEEIKTETFLTWLFSAFIGLIIFFFVRAIHTLVVRAIYTLVIFFFFFFLLDLNIFFLFCFVI
jgi:hypothetical protein